MEYFELAKTNMVKNQIMPRGVVDERILEAFLNIPKHEFLDEKFKGIAYFDGRIYVAPSRCILSPEVHAMLLNKLDLKGEEKVLDVGCTVGYTSAILSQLSKQVIGLEILDLVKSTAETLKYMKLLHVQIKQGPLLLGDEEEAPFDRIIINGALSKEPSMLINQLVIGGKLIYIKQVSDVLCKAILIEKLESGLKKIELFDTFCDLIE